MASPNPAAYNINLPTPSGFLAGQLMGQQSNIMNEQRLMQGREFETEQAARELKLQQERADEEAFKQDERKLKGHAAKTDINLYEQGLIQALKEAKAREETSTARLKDDDNRQAQRVNGMLDLAEELNDPGAPMKYQDIRRRYAEKGITLPAVWSPTVAQDAQQRAQWAATNRQTLQNRLSADTAVSQAVRTTEGQEAAKEPYRMTDDMRKYIYAKGLKAEDYTYAKALAEYKGDLELQIAGIKSMGDGAKKEMKHWIYDKVSRGEMSPEAGLKLAAALNVSGQQSELNLPETRRTGKPVFETRTERQAGDISETLRGTPFASQPQAAPSAPTKQGEPSPQQMKEMMILDKAKIPFALKEGKLIFPPERRQEVERLLRGN